MHWYGLMPSMSPITILWSMAAASSLVMGVIHGMVWLADRKVRFELWFALAAICMSAYPFFDLALMAAKTQETYGAVGRWALLPISLMIAAILMLVHTYFGTGRRWLLLLALGTRLLAILVNMACEDGLFFNGISEIKHISFMGETVSQPIGEMGKWLWIEHVGAVIWLSYIIDASVNLWRKGTVEARRRVILLGGGTVVILSLGLVQASLTVGLVIEAPVMVTPFFTILILGMGFELSRDVLRSAQLTRKLRESEQRLELAATAARLALWEWDLPSGNIWVSSTGRALYGIPSGEEVNFSRFVATLHPLDRDLVMDAVKISISTSIPFAAEYRVILPDNGERWISAAGRVEQDAAGNPLLLRGVSYDVTVRKLAEEAALDKAKTLEHLSRVAILGELTGSIAHELNQPLAALLSNAQAGKRFLKQSPPAIDEIPSILDDIEADTKRAGGIIHSMRAMLKKDASVVLQEVNLNSCLQQVLGLLRGEILACKVNITHNLVEPPPVIWAGQVEIQQVLVNLLINAFDALKTVATQRQVHLETAWKDSLACVIVRDNGPGLPTKIRDRLFEPFTSTKPGGLGLGLVISRSIVEQFGGKISAENHPDGGAVFRLSLPMIQTPTNVSTS